MTLLFVQSAVIFTALPPACITRSSRVRRCLSVIGEPSDSAFQPIQAFQQVQLDRLTQHAVQLRSALLAAVTPEQLTLAVEALIQQAVSGNDLLFTHLRWDRTV